MGVFLKVRQKLVTFNKFREKLLFLIYAIFPNPCLVLQPHVSWKCPSSSLLSYSKGSEGNPGWRWVTALEGSSSSTLSCFVSFVGNTHLLYTLPSSDLCILTFRNFFILELWSCSLFDFTQSLDLPDVQRRVFGVASFPAVIQWAQCTSSEQGWLKELVLLWSPCCFLGYHNGTFSSATPSVRDARRMAELLFGKNSASFCNQSKKRGSLFLWGL